MSKLLARYRRHRAWRKVVWAMGCLVVFCTTYALILPAITLEKTPACGKEEHTHTEQCYTQTLSVEKTVPVCTLESLGLHVHTEDCLDENEQVCCGYADFIAHKHDDRCYDENGQLWCPIPEKEAHTHDESCYETAQAETHTERERGDLICTESTEATHTHTQECYAGQTVLTCQLPEGDGHRHGESCRNENGELICGQEEHEAHIHGDQCYTTEPVLTCTISDIPHRHTDECYNWIEVEVKDPPSEPVLICDKEEILLHTHTMADCYQCDEDGNNYLICTALQILEHVHSDGCFQTVEEKTESLTCGLEEHTHTPECMVDIETEEDWTATLPQTLSGDWRADLLAVAESQLDYAETQSDLHLGEDVRRFSRYGAWYGQPEGKWNSLYVLFCLHYAEIPEENLPRDSAPDVWARKLAGQTEGYEAFQLYHGAEDYLPCPGDLAFLDSDGDGKADRVGIVSAYEEASATLEILEGDVSGKVAKQTYPSVTVLGYGSLPDDPTQTRPLFCGKEEHTHTELCADPDTKEMICGKEEHTHSEDCFIPQPREYRYEDDTVLVTVVLPAESQVPTDASLRVTPITREEERYSLLEQQAKEAAKGTLGQLVLYDVSFYTQSGEYLPVEEAAAVTVTFKQEVLSGDQVEVIHYGEDSAPVALDGVEVQRDENDALSGLSFQTEGFSVFGLMTTRTISASPRDPGDITLYPGQVYTVDEVYTNKVEQSTTGVVKVNPQPYDNILKTGSGEDDYEYPGERQPIGNAEYTFTLNGNGKYTAYHSSGSENIYFNMSTGNDARPSSETSAEFSILDKDSPLTGDGVVLPNDTYHIPEGRFALSSNDPSRCLFFHSTTADYGTRLGFRVNEGVYSHWGCNLVLFKKAENGETPSSEMPGFVQVTSKDQIVSGKQYLIAGKASEGIDGNYYVLYPNASAANRYQHTAKVSPYKLTLTAQNYGDGTAAEPVTTTVTAGSQQWTVTVNEQVSVSEGGTLSIPLPADATVTSADTTIATVERDSETNDVVLTGVKRGSTTVTIQEGEQTYTWYVTVTNPTSFQIEFSHNNSPVMTFHLKDANTGEDLEVDAVPNYTGAAATKYILVEEGSEPAEAGPNQQYIVVPKIDGYRFSGAEYYRSWIAYRDWIPISGFVTTGYSDSEIEEVTRWTNFVFYQNGKPAPTYNLGNDVKPVDVNLNYRKLPITTTVSPSGTTINLFDYWVTDKNEGQVGGPNDAGINAGHALHFTTGGESLALNWWTGADGGVFQGIVANRLGADGYPCLSGNHQGDGSSKESLAYLFDPNTPEGSRDTYRNVGGLLQIDSEGYYYYDSAVNYAEYDQASNQFKLYPDWAVQYKPDGRDEPYYGQFFPLDPYDTVTQDTNAGNWGEKKLNHFLGMTMTTRFIQMEGGYTNTLKETPMTYEFSGDDDVWIFIDGVLVADVGGIHDPASVKIDFSQGTVVISKVNGGSTNVETRFSDIFNGTGVALNDKGVFHDNTYHTLKFFYMERGGNASNLHLKFNLVTFPASGITKVDQVGDPIAGAEFALYRTNADYVVNEGDIPVCSGTTGANGEFVFTGADGHPLILQDLYEGTNGTGGPYPYYVLQETNIPQGYRGTGTDIHLQILKGGVQGASGSNEGNATSYVMTCTNTRDSGAFASPSLQVTASSSLQLMDDAKTQIVPGVNQGTLFGIVLKYIGPEGTDKNLENWANWSPVYGSAAEGYTVVDRTRYPEMKDAIAYAKDKYPGNQNYFHQSSNGSYQALIEDLPGDIGTYNFMAGNDNQEKVQYIVSYYWTDAKTGKTTRVQDFTTSGGTYAFARTFGTDIQVPNMNNRIAVQKLDDLTDQPINGATFAMYEVEDTDINNGGGSHANNDYFYVAYDASGNPVHLYLEPDTDGDYLGQAKSCFDSADDPNGWKGSYTVAPKTGIITVTLNNDSAKPGTYTITPLHLKTTVGASQNNYKEDGIAEFDTIVAGKYIIRELTAPTGYTVNPNHAMVLVTSNAIYANAGTAADRIAVSRGPGYLAGNLHYYASIGEIESSLTWVYDQMKVSGVSSKFSDVASGNYANWKWVQTKRADVDQTVEAQLTSNRKEALTAYLEFINPGSGGEGETSARFSYAVDPDPNRPHTVSENVGPFRRLYTNTGWSYLEILQDYDYGKNAKSPHANYENWQYVLDADGSPKLDPSGNPIPDDLSNLFSRSIYVHVSDIKEPGTLEISKKVAGEGAPDDTFTFTVSLANPKYPIANSYKYTVYDISGGTPQPVAGSENLDLTFTNGTAAVSLKHNQSIKIEGIPAGTTYEIKENTPPKYTTTAVEKVLENGVKAQKDHSGSVVSGPMYWHVENDADGNPKLDSASKVDFTNTYDASLDTVTMTIRKVNADDLTARLADAEFTLTREKGGKTEYNTGSAWTETPTALTTSSISGEISFSLIENGTYTLTETKAPDGYYPLTGPITIVVGKVTVEGKEQTVITSATMGDQSFETVEGNRLLLIVPNECGYELPHTGGTGSTVFYASGAALLLTALLLLIPKRKPENH